MPLPSPEGAKAGASDVIALSMKSPFSCLKLIAVAIFFAGQSQMLQQSPSERNKCNSAGKSQSYASIPVLVFSPHVPQRAGFLFARDLALRPQPKLPATPLSLQRVKRPANLSYRFGAGKAEGKHLRVSIRRGRIRFQPRPSSNFVLPRPKTVLG
jgi:hypothetical protein